MGCGKSTAAAMLEEHGFRRIDSDAIVRGLLAGDRPVIQSIEQRFGPAVIGREGNVDRAALAHRVFSSESELEWLENLLHPRVFEAWKEELGRDPQLPKVFEVPLLFEKKLQKWFDFTVCVSSSLSQQLLRLEQRGLPEQLARQRIARQAPLSQKIELADFVLLNDGSLSFLRDQVRLLVQRLAF